jgi:hypothetical protein
MAGLAEMYWNQGRWDKTEELQVQVIQTKRTKLGMDHPSILTSMNNLAFIWKRQGRNTEAIKLIEECVILGTRIIGINHPDTSSSLETLLGLQIEELEMGASVDRDLDR